MRYLCTLLTVATLSACGSIGSTSGHAPAPEDHRLVVHNQTDSRVKIYLVESNSEWLLGRVSALASNALRMPADWSPEDASTVRLVAIPFATQDPARNRFAKSPNIIRSEPELSGDLTAMSWTLSGTQFFGTPRGPMTAALR